MIVFLNGKFVPDHAAKISVFDRGFLYGDGLFEGVLITNGKPFHWHEHIERLRAGIKFLGLTLRYADEELLAAAREMVKRNKMRTGILRLSLSRGVTERGYSPAGARSPAFVMTLHPAPLASVNRMLRWNVVTASFRLPVDSPLTRFKTANKLSQVLARAEADAAGAPEALLLNAQGRMGEGTTSNIFWVKNGAVFTTALSEGALPGVTRGIIISLCGFLKIPCGEIQAKISELLAADGAFLTMTSAGLVEIARVDGRPVRRSPLTKKLWIAYQHLLK